MKKMLLSLFLISGTALSSVAQAQVSNTAAYTLIERYPRSPQENTSWAISFYSDVLNLTSEQKNKISDPVEKFEREFAAANTTEEKTVAALSQHLYLQQEFQNILTYVQYRKFEQIDQYPDGVLNPNLEPLKLK